MKEILLNRMYVGGYLQNNIGHEIINLFKSDSGKNYIYINPYGTIFQGHDDKNTQTILLVRGINATTMETIAKAVNLIPVLDNSSKKANRNEEQRNYIDKNNITYGEVKLYEIYKNNDGANNKNTIYISFEAENIFYPKEKIYITTNQNNNISNKHEVLSEVTFPKQALHWAYQENSKAYETLKKLIDDSSVWQSRNQTQTILEIKKNFKKDDNFNFLKLIKKEYDELSYSNMFQYFLKTDKKLFEKFMREVLGLNPQGSYTIGREIENIDLFIEDETNIVVIENKIKSAINGVRHDIYSDLVQSQLSKYYNYAAQNKNGKEISCFIFSPNYNKINIKGFEKSEHYRIIEYSKLFNFFKNYKDNCKNDKYYNDFVSALKIHSKDIDNSNFEIMQERFIEQIDKILDKND